MLEVLHLSRGTQGTAHSHSLTAVTCFLHSMLELDRYLEAEGDSNSNSISESNSNSSSRLRVDQSIQYGNALSQGLQDLGTASILDSSSSSSSPSSSSLPSSQRETRPDQYHIHRITDDELQPPDVQEERRRKSVEEIMSRTVHHRKEECERMMDQFVARFEAAQRLRKQKFEKLMEAIDLEFQDIEAEFGSDDYSDGCEGESTFHHQGRSEFGDVNSKYNEKNASNAMNFLHNFERTKKTRNSTGKDKIKNGLDDATAGDDDNRPVATTDDLGLMGQIDTTIELLDLSSPPRGKNIDAGYSDVIKSVDKKTLDDLLGFDFNTKENLPFPPSQSNLNLSQSTIEIDFDSSKLEDHMMHLLGASNNSELADTGNKPTHRANIDLSSSQPAKPVPSLSLKEQQHSLFSSTVHKVNKSVTFNLDNSASTFLYENNRNSDELESGNFLPVQHMTHHLQPEDLEGRENNAISSIEQDASGESNNSIIHCNFDMSSRGPGKHKRGRLH